MPQAGTLSDARYYRKSAPQPGSTALAPATTPPAIQAGLVRAGMDARAYLGPGRPLNPAIGYSGRPRATDYPMSVNVATQGRAAWGRPAYSTLKKIIEAYDVARMCTNHKIDELRSMEPMFLPADGVKEDVDDEIAVARLVLTKPDRELPYDSWLSKWLENVVKYDSGPLYRRRNMAGEIIALEVIDGTTFNPYIDEYGRRPEPPEPAFFQTIHGMVAQWLTTDDCEFVPFRPQEDSPFGLAPIESILLTANTDLRHQWHLLQMFTEGSVPAGFMELPPDISSPEQVAEWQDYWDSMILGDQAKITQLIAVPNGSKFTGTKPAAFSKEFPHYLMTRVCAAYGVVPQDIGLIEDVNRSNGETQVDVQFRVNTLPWVRYVEGVLTRYLQRDLGLRVQIKLDTGRDKEDRLAEAQAHQLYVEMGAESPDEVRSEVLGLPIDKERPTPRFVLVQRVGPIPLLSIEGIAGRTDPETHGPAQDQPALDQPYVPPVGVIPTPGTTDDKAALAANDQMQIAQRRQLEQQQGNTPLRESREEKHARGAKAMQDDADARSEASDEHDAVQPASEQGAEDEQQPAKPVAKQLLDGQEAAELAAFRTFVAGRVRKGAWRDFAFSTLPSHIAAELNRGGRAEVTAKLVAKAQDSQASKNTPGLTARSGMISLDLDPGTIPVVDGGVPDHHITIVYLGPDVDDEAFERACLRAQAAASAEDGPVEGTVGGLGSFPPSDGSDGKIPVYAQVDVPATHDLYVRLKDLSASGRQTYVPHVTLLYADADSPLPAILVPDTAVRFTHLSVHRGDQVMRYPLGGPNAVTQAEVVKARFDDGPKAQAGSSADWPGWQYDREAAAYWGPRVAAAILGALDLDAIAQGWLTGAREHDNGHQDDKARRASLILTAQAWLHSYQARIVSALRPVLAELWTDGYAIGTAAADVLTRGGEMDMGSWEAGDTAEAERIILAQTDGAGLRALFEAAQHTIGLIAEARTDAMARALADAVMRRDAANVLGDALRTLLANPDRAVRLALSEISRSSGAGAQAVYGVRQVATHKWLTAEDERVCPICRANEDQGPVPLGAPFLSGDYYQPAHPGGCRCATVPGPTLGR